MGGNGGRKKLRSKPSSVVQGPSNSNSQDNGPQESDLLIIDIATTSGVEDLVALISGILNGDHGPNARKIAVSDTGNSIEHLTSTVSNRLAHDIKGVSITLVPVDHASTPGRQQSSAASVRILYIHIDDGIVLHVHPLPSGKVAFIRIPHIRSTAHPVLSPDISQWLTSFGQVPFESFINHNPANNLIANHDLGPSLTVGAPIPSTLIFSDQFGAQEHPHREYKHPTSNPVTLQTIQKYVKQFGPAIRSTPANQAATLWVGIHDATKNVVGVELKNTRELSHVVTPLKELFPPLAPGCVNVILHPVHGAHPTDWNRCKSANLSPSQAHAALVFLSGRACICRRDNSSSKTDAVTVIADADVLEAVQSVLPTEYPDELLEVSSIFDARSEETECVLSSTPCAPIDSTYSQVDLAQHPQQFLAFMSSAKNVFEAERNKGKLNQQQDQSEQEDIQDRRHEPRLDLSWVQKLNWSDGTPNGRHDVIERHVLCIKVTVPTAFEGTFFSTDPKIEKLVADAWICPFGSKKIQQMNAFGIWLRLQGIRPTSGLGSAIKGDFHLKILISSTAECEPALDRIACEYVGGHSVQIDDQIRIVDPAESNHGSLDLQFGRHRVIIADLAAISSLTNNPKSEASERVRSVFAASTFARRRVLLAVPLTAQLSDVQTAKTTITSLGGELEDIVPLGLPPSPSDTSPKITSRIDVDAMILRYFETVSDGNDAEFVDLLRVARNWYQDPGRRPPVWALLKHSLVVETSQARDVADHLRQKFCKSSAAGGLYEEKIGKPFRGAGMTSLLRAVAWMLRDDMRVLWARELPKMGSDVTGLCWDHICAMKGDGPILIISDDHLAEEHAIFFIENGTKTGHFEKIRFPIVILRVVELSLDVLTTSEDPRRPYEQLPRWAIEPYLHNNDVISVCKVMRQALLPYVGEVQHVFDALGDLFKAAENNELGIFDRHVSIIALTVTRGKFQPAHDFVKEMHEAILRFTARPLHEFTESLAFLSTFCSKESSALIQPSWLEEIRESPATFLAFDQLVQPFDEGRRKNSRISFVHPFFAHLFLIESRNRLSFNQHWMDREILFTLWKDVTRVLQGSQSGDDFRLILTRVLIAPRPSGENFTRFVAQFVEHQDVLAEAKSGPSSPHNNPALKLDSVLEIWKGVLNTAFLDIVRSRAFRLWSKQNRKWAQKALDSAVKAHQALKDTEHDRLARNNVAEALGNAARCERKISLKIDFAKKADHTFQVLYDDDPSFERTVIQTVNCFARIPDCKKIPKAKFAEKWRGLQKDQITSIQEESSTECWWKQMNKFERNCLNMCT